MKAFLCANVKTLISINRFIQLNFDCNICEDCTSQQKSKKRTFQKKLQWALRKLENREFHVRISERWIVIDNVRSHKKIDFFWFDNEKQIHMTKKFESETMIQIDTTFNINNLLFFLFVLMNTNTSFFVIYVTSMFDR